MTFARHPRGTYGRRLLAEVAPTSTTVQPTSGSSSWGGTFLSVFREKRGHRETGDLYAAKQLARHASVRTTEAYLHPTADELRARMLESDGGKRA